jgi:hypothetical protein
MTASRRLWLPVLAGMVVATAGPATALDTLRVGLFGNIPWTGASLIDNVEAIPPEYKVERQLTLIGNSPGNLIDMVRLQDTLPKLLILTVINAADRDADEVTARISATLLTVLEQLPGIAQTEIETGGNLFSIVVSLDSGTDLLTAAALVDEALDVVRPLSALETGEGGDVVVPEANLDCTEMIQEFESTSTVTSEWGACESGLSGARGFYTDCFRVECKNRDTGAITSTPGRLAGKRLAGKRLALAQEDEETLERLPEGVNPVVLPIALGPSFVARGENVAQRALGWDGRITAPAITDVTRSELATVLLELIAPEGSEDAFQRKGIQGALGTFIVLDLGAPIGVNRVRFYPRNTVQPAPNYAFQSDFLRQFELMLHDGNDLVLDGTGRLVPQLQDYKVLRRSVDNQEAVVDVSVIPPQLVRFIRLKAISSFPYEIDELEAFGQGFISQARYLSPVYDLGSPATWGNISWIERFVDKRVQGDDGAVDVPDNCDIMEQQFATAEEIPETWGGCDTVTKYRDGVGYVLEWTCFQAVCRDESGGQTVTPGAGKTVAARPAQLAQGSELSRISMRTRTGSDSTPVLYFRRNVERLSDSELSESVDNPGEQLGRDEYLGLKPALEANPPVVWDKGEITEDLAFWSPWSAVYRNGHLPGGVPVLSPGPRRYIQFSVEFDNQVIDATKIIEQLSIEYLSPPIADDLIAEIFPREVKASETVSFTYAVRALMNIPGVKGFDRFEISTPTRILGIDRIRIHDGTPEEAILSEQEFAADIAVSETGEIEVLLGDGSRHPIPYNVVSAAGDTFGIESVADGGFVVRFPVVERPSRGGQRVVKIDFRSRVLLFSTVFPGAARFSAEQGTVQRITPGNASFLGEGDLPTASGVTVLSPDITRGNLVEGMELSPNPFTPNNDGINDVLEISYDITAVTRAADVSMRIHDLSGRQVRELYRGEDLSGHYDSDLLPGLSWDGRDDNGDLVPPGIYILRASVKGDARSGERLRTIAVVY